MLDMVKAFLRVKFTALNAYVRRVLKSISYETRNKSNLITKKRRGKRNNKNKSKNSIKLKIEK